MDGHPGAPAPDRTPLTGRLTVTTPGEDSLSTARSSPFAVSRYHDCMAKQTTVRLPEELAEQAEAVARVRGSSVNQLIVDSLAEAIERVRADEKFTERAKQLLDRDKELLDRLAK